ncbi:hypothetical protein ABPG75_012479 [Micractinium tetrahymenae]
MRALTAMTSCPAAPVVGASRGRRFSGVPSLPPARRRLCSVAVTAGMTNPDWAPQPPSQQPAVGALQAAPPAKQAAQPGRHPAGPGWRDVAHAAAYTAISLLVCMADYRAGWVLTASYAAVFTALTALSTLVLAVAALICK